LQADLGVPKAFFAALSTEPQGIRSSVQDALTSLAGAYK
jgi:hypothetical protein